MTQPTLNRSPSPALHRLLDLSLNHSPEHGPRLSSHLPMALAALDGLGADEARLNAFFDQAARRIPLVALAPDATACDDWPVLRGHFEAFATLRATFGVALARDGRDAVLRDTLPQLISGAGAAAFHGLIRTAHAVESQHEAELAAALAYWAARWLPLDAPEATEPDIDGVADWLDALDDRFRRADGGWHSPANLISIRMQKVTATHAYRELAGRLRTVAVDTDDLLHELALAAATRYAATANFTVLHLATGSRAARVLAPWLPTGDASLQPLWHAVAAANLASGAQPRPAASVESTLDWPTVIERACASDDEHTIKLVHAMAMQHADAPHPTWLQAARVAVETGAP